MASTTVSVSYNDLVFLDEKLGCPKDIRQQNKNSGYTEKYWLRINWNA